MRLPAAIESMARRLDRLGEQSGATTLEWALLLAFIALPSYYVIQLALGILVGHYRILTTMNALPLP
ncbi:MAG: hypothetical protein CMJ49_06870 [Planctomycetaceae bacterium]|nr:hypothetical protein [Planctomycetaceae bacterium]